MQSPRQTRSTVLGKRTHRSESSVGGACDQLVTPESTPSLKRVRTSSTELDGDHNKENIPPLVFESSGSLTPRAARAIRRHATETDVVASPTRPRTGIRRASTSSLVTPSTPSSKSTTKANLATPPPSPHLQLLPLYSRASASLRATCDNATDLPGRSAERAIIESFATSFLADSVADKTTLYISGSPGTGKTALVNSILRALPEEMRVISINCVSLVNIDALWNRLTEELSASKKRKSPARVKKPAKGKDAVQALISDLGSKCVLILDELDHIASNPQSLASLFSIPAYNPSSLRVIGIANTHTLTSSETLSSAVQTLHFAPYTPQQLLDVIDTRLAPLRDDTTGKAETIDTLLPKATLTFLSKRVASLTGDVRSVFEILRGAIDLAVKASETFASPVVAIPHIVSAVKSHMPTAAKTGGTTINSETVNKVKVLGLPARVVLTAVLAALKRLDLNLPLAGSTQAGKCKSLNATTLELSTLFTFYTAMLARDDSDVFTAVSRNEFGDLLSMLEGVGLLANTASFAPSPAKAKRGLARTTSKTLIPSGEVKLCEGVCVEEILKGLGIRDDVSKPVEDTMEEEVSGLWRQEMSRVSRELKIAEAKAAKEKEKRTAAFSDATEN
ncbi:P-loop containing nucleoside triphosphate hydrolase protein [Cylindrobasidium torrendii FP15055 ss-10]|uniref:p-loop containing nucleoside triphosphate hydrolase protein n=1 Tax=Cylindrobasidium torrendii FP15055 ss-10 TaxID=1314674 RepID=A0A0D7ATK4_9AGAR|nr:P-loop containing nucleoside triphosphate hydrolase protein [Cylindrobasidium torrendii FP15055 ss-10]